MKKIILFVIYSIVMRTVLKIFSGTKLINKQNLVYKGPCIIVGNHNSHLDTISVLAHLSFNQLHRTHPIAAGDYFGKSRFKAAMTRFFVNAVLIPRSRPKEDETGPDPIQMMVEVLQKGDSLLLFPEGSRGEPEKFQKFKRGVGLVLEQCPDVPYIPIYMKGMGKILPKGDPVPVPFDSYLRVGEPVFPKGKNAEEIVAEVELKIRTLMEED